MSDYWKKKLDELNNNGKNSSSTSDYWQNKMTELEEERKRKKKEEEERKKAVEQENLLNGMTPTQQRFHDKTGGFVDTETSWADQTDNAIKRILGGLDTEYAETDRLLKQLKAQQDKYAREDLTYEKEQVELHGYYNNLLVAKNKDILSKTTMDGKKHSVLEEMQLLTDLSGDEKEKRKEAVFKKMEELGIPTEQYALYTDDSNFNWSDFGGWLKSSASAGLNSFNLGIAKTADLLVGKLLTSVGWENNPVSMVEELYEGMYEKDKFNQQLYAERLGGGAGWSFAGDAAEGTMGAVPNALLALMTMGASSGATTADLTTKAAYEVGNVLTKAGLTVSKMMQNPQYWLSFARTYGPDYEEAKERGASDSVAILGATLTSLVNAGIEIGTDGASGIQGLPDDLLSGNKNKVWAWIESGLEETGEEGLQKFVGEMVTKTLYDHDAEILNPVEYGREMALGAVSGLALGGGQMTVQSGVNAGVNAYNQYQANKLTTDEQTVLDKVVEEKIAEEEQKNGKKLTATEKRDIKKQMLSNLRSGQISIEKIEEIFGGDSYNAFIEARDAFRSTDDYKAYEKAAEKKASLAKMQERYDALVKMENKTTRQIQEEINLKRKIEEIANDKTLKRLETKLRPEAGKVIGLQQVNRGEIMKRVKGTHLAESYLEYARSKEKLDIDINKYTNEYAKRTVQTIVDGGYGNNSNAFKATVDLLAKMSADRGIDILASDSEAINKMKSTKKGKYIHGFVTTDENGTTITLNMDSPRLLQTTVGHEISHVLEKAKVGKELAQAVKNYAITKEGLERYNARIKEAEELYKGDKDTTPEQEVVADLIGEYLFTDSDFVNNLSTQNRNVFMKMFDEIKYFCKIATAGSKEAREFERVKKLFEDAYRENVKGKEGVRNSYSGINAKTADAQKLAEAEELLESGVDSETIRQETGWFKGYDGKWRYEVSDSEMEIKKNLTNGQFTKYIDGETLKLDDIIKHDALFDAYPEIRDTAVVLKRTLGKNIVGSYSADTDTLSVSGSIYITDEMFKEMLIHEIQHKVQNIEGFARGSSPKYWETKGVGEAEYESFVANSEREKAKILKGLTLEERQDYLRYVETDKQIQEALGRVDTEAILRGDDSDSMNAIKDIEAIEVENDALYNKLYSADWFLKLQEIDSTLNEGVSEKLYTVFYKNTAGEIEARDVSKRVNYTDEQRLDTRPDIDRANVTFADRGDSLAYIGDTKDGRRCYQSSFDSSVSMADRIKAFEKRIATIFNLGAVELKTDVKKIRILGDRFTAQKNLYGDEYAEPGELSAKVSALYDLADILATAKYIPSRTAKEPSYANPNEKPKNKAHKDVKYWYKFKNEIVFDGVPFTVTFSIRDKGSQQYQYLINFKENKTPGLSNTAVKSLLRADQVSYDANIAQNEPVVKTQYSYSSIANAFFGEDDMNTIEFLARDYHETEFYKQYVDDCINNMRQTKPDFDESRVGEYEESIKKQLDGIVDVAVAMKQAGYDIADTRTIDEDGAQKVVPLDGIKDSKNRSLFSSLEPNSDYITSHDISTICDKRKNFAEIYDEIVRIEESKGVPKGKRFFDNVNNYFAIHKIMADKGLTTPCRQCYVESMRKNLAPMASAFLELVQEANPNNTANAQLFHQKGKNKGQLKVNNESIREGVLAAMAEHPEYNLSAEDLTIEMLTTEDGLAQLRIQAPLVYEAFNSFYGQAKPKMPKSATPFRFGELTAMLTKSNGEINQNLIDKINATGGFRLQSYSDFQIQNYADVLQVLFEAGTLGLNGHAYTKVPAFLDATEGTNLKRNISIFMYKDGDEWKLDRNDSFPYALEEIYELVKADKTGNTSIIAVSQNNEMSAWIMANDLVGYGIPFHKSGLKMSTVRDTIVRTEDGREVKGYTNTKDHTKQQTEVYKTDVYGEDGKIVNKANTKVKKGIDIYSIWDFENNGNLSRNELIEKNLKAYIDACEDAGYRPKFRDYVMNNDQVLKDVLRFSKELGYVSKNATIEDISFEYKGYRIPYGYYKFLGDFGMFTPDGKAAPQKALSLENYDFDKAKAFFEDAEALRRTEILQQFANGKVRDEYRDSDMTTEELEALAVQKRTEVAHEALGTKFSMSKDSEGTQLTLAQDKFFKDTVIRDEDGNIMPMYHGTKKGGFTVFGGKKDYWYFTKDEKYADTFEGRQENGEYYPLVQEGIDEGYYTPQKYKVYLNVKNPFITDDIDVIEDALYWDETLTGKLREKGYDALMLDDMSQVIILNQNQIKNVDNANPTEDVDIRYSISKDGDEIAPSPMYEDGRYLGYRNSVNERIRGLAGDDIAPADDLPIRKDINPSAPVTDVDESWKESVNAITDDDAPPEADLPVGNAPVEKITSVEERLQQKINNTQTELDNNRILREQSFKDYDEEIARLQAKYDSKQNKNSKVAQSILRSIERLKRLQGNIDADYAKRISDLEARVEKMNSPEYKTSEKRRAKMKEHTDFWEATLGDTSTWKDMALGLAYKTKTLRRILRKVVRDANGKPDIAKADAIYDALETKYDHNEAQLKKESVKLKEVFKKLNLNHTEDTYAHMLGEFRHNPQTTLTEDVVNEYYEKHKNKIDVDKVNKAIEESRKTFDELIVRVNNVLKEQGMKEIPYRKGYFPHFTNPKQGWLAKLLNWKTIDTEIPTSIAGLTEQFDPQRSWQGFNKQRKGDTTDYSLYQGLDTYIHGALDWIYHIDDLQSRRALENYIRYIHSEEGVKAKIDEIKANDYLDADQTQVAIDAVLAEAKNPLNNLVTELRARTNTLANKKASMDRGMEEATNRKIYSTMTNLNNRINANMVVGSISSALTNFIPMVQSWHQVSPVYTVKGLGDFVRSVVHDDGMVAKSDYLTNRLVDEEKLYQTGWDKVSDKAAWLMNTIDNITSQTVWRSKYLQNLHEGMSESEAIKDADQFAKNLMAGRSRGNAPSIFDAKNPIIKIATAFQLEVANQYGFMFEDTPQDVKSKARLVKGYAAAFLGAYMYNALYSSLVGRDAAFDPISIIEDLFGDLFDDDDDDEDDVKDALLGLGENIVQELPYVGGLVGGGRVPMSSALPYSGDSTPFESMMTDVTEGNWDSVGKELLKPLYYLAMPVGGGQIKKTVEGLSMFDDDLPISGSYTDSGKLRFPVEKNVGNVVQAAVFGQYASKNAREYFDEGYAPLSEKQIQEYMDVDIPISDYWKYRKGLKGKDSLGEKLAYIDSLDLPIRKQNILANNLADREEPINMADWDKYDGLEEYDYAKKYPEKHLFLEANGISVKQYNSFDDETKDAWSWAYKNPGKYAMSKAVTSDLMQYRRYANDLGDIRADKDIYGNAISGSAKQKKLDYINSLNIDYGAKLILYKSQYKTDNLYNYEIVEYLNSIQEFSYEDRIEILKELGFTIVGDGTVQWD